MTSQKALLTKSGHPMATTTIYRKPTHTDRLLDQSSYNLTSHKATTIRTLTRWAHLVCDSPDSLQDETDYLNNIFSNKDKPEDRQGAVYKIKCCDCQASYIGETGRNLSTRLTEHKRATRNGDVNNHIAEHHLQTKHRTDWDSATCTCITYSTDYYQRLTLESWLTSPLLPMLCVIVFFSLILTCCHCHFHSYSNLQRSKSVGLSVWVKGALRKKWYWSFQRNMKNIIIWTGMYSHRWGNTEQTFLKVKAAFHSTAPLKSTSMYVL